MYLQTHSLNCEMTKVNTITLTHLLSSSNYVPNDFDDDADISRVCMFDFWFEIKMFYYTNREVSSCQ